jgi:hypothetical protein
MKFSSFRSGICYTCIDSMICVCVSLYSSCLFGGICEVEASPIRNDNQHQFFNLCVTLQSHIHIRKMKRSLYRVGSL